VKAIFGLAVTHKLQTLRDNNFSVTGDSVNWFLQQLYNYGRLEGNTPQNLAAINIVLISRLSVKTEVKLGDLPTQLNSKHSIQVRRTVAMEYISLSDII